jgi:hypothetical protein
MKIPLIWVFLGHACGEASDLVLRACGRAGAQMVVAPCCVGKLNRRVLNPYVFHATGRDLPTITYPQSTAFKEISPPDWDALTKAADYSDWDEMRSSGNATRRTAKAILEMDRLLFLQEQYRYSTALVRMDPWEASPKHDILLAWHVDEWSPFKLHLMTPDTACNADVQLAWTYLLESNELATDSVDWTLEEQRLVERELQQFIDSEELHYTFPTRMGSRKRKLIHYVAHRFQLRHWPEGLRDGDKTVQWWQNLQLQGLGRNDNNTHRTCSLSMILDTLYRQELWVFLLLAYSDLLSLDALVVCFQRRCASQDIVKLREDFEPQQIEQHIGHTFQYNAILQHFTAAQSRPP